MRAIFIAITLCISVALPAGAQSPDPKPILEWQKRQTADERLTVFGDDLLGDSVDTNLGSLVFEHTDISLPGNSGLPVALVRRRSQGSLFDEGVNVDFADWELVVPKISAVTTTTHKWAGQRCSGNWSQTFPTLSYGQQLYDRSAYSNGVSMDIPGQGAQEVLKLGATSHYPSSAKASTVNEWFFTCTTASDGKQGFIGHAPNGDKYYFTRVILRPYKEMGFANTDQKVNRTKVILAASEVRDVNNNWVRYTYNSQDRLTRIEANDGRLITLTHSSGLITSATANGRTWTYGYRDSNYFKPDWDVNRPGSYNGRVLHRVTQPDSKYWSFTLDNMQAEPSPASRSCDRMNYTLTVKHPYGVTGTFKIKDIQHRQAYKYFTTVVDDCFDYDIEPEPPGGGWGNLQEPVELLSTRTFSVTSKKLSSPNMADALWSFSYEQDDVCQGVPSNLCDSYTGGGGTTPPPPPPPPPGPPIGGCNGDQLCRDGGANALAAGALAAPQDTYSRVLDSLYPRKSDGSKSKSVVNLRNSLGDLVEEPPSQAYWNTNSAPYDTSAVFTHGGEDPLDYTNWTKVTQPSGAVITYYHLWNYLPVAGGKLIKQVTTEGNNTLDELNTFYVQHSCNGSRMLFSGNPAAPGHCPTHTSKTVQKREGDTFTNEYAFNMNTAASNYSFGQPVETKVRSNVNTTPRISTMTYQHIASPWVTGLLKSTNVLSRNTDSHSYDTRGRKLTESRHGRLYARYTYNNDGTLSTIKDGNNRITTFTDWKRGTAQNVQRPDLSRVYQYVDNNGWLNQSIDGNGHTTNYTRDTMGRLKVFDRPTQSSTTIAYTFGTNPTQTFKRGNRTEKITYDSMFRPKVVSVNNVTYTQFQYDAAGRTIFESYPHTSATYAASQGANGTLPEGKFTSYDGLNRIRSVTTPDGITNHRYYSGHQHRIIDPDGKMTMYYSLGFDGPNNKDYRAIYEYKNGAYARRTYLYKNMWSELYRVRQWGALDGINRESNQYLYYNGDRRICRYRTSEGGDTLYQYDSAGWLKAYQQGVVNGSSCVTPSGTDKVSLQRDVLDRVKRVDFADSNEHDVYTTYDGNGNPLTVNRGGANWTYTYNAVDQLLSERLNFDGQSYPLQYRYNWHGYLDRRTLPTGRQINYQFDSLGRQVSVKNGTTVNLATGITYHPDDQVAQLTYGNGHVYEKTVNDMMRPTRIRAYKNSTVAMDYTYSYNNTGRIATMGDGILPSNNRTYTYDAIGQISRVQFGGGPVYTYKYDSVGNIRQKKLGSRTINMAYSSKNRLSSYTDTHGANKTLSYDNIGNVASLGSQNFLYDLNNQPISAAGGDASGTYRYDGNLKRVQADINGKKINNVYDRAGKLVLTHDLSTNKKTDFIQIADMDGVRIDNAGLKYVHSDLLGSPRALTSSTGQVQQTAVYTPYGMKISGNMPEDLPGFTGHIKDAATGLSYMQARYYDPVSSRFLSIDPITFMDVPNPGMFNRYTYALNDPANLRDPDGQCPICVPIAIFLIKEIAAEVASQATGGATDILSLRRTGKNVLKRLTRNKPKADFVVDPNGTAVRTDPVAARRDLENAGYPGTKTTKTTEGGTVHTDIPTEHGAMDVRIMDGQSDPGKFKGPRVVTSRAGAPQDLRRTDGSQIKGNDIGKPQRRAESHIHLEPE